MSSPLPPHPSIGSSALLLRAYVVAAHAALLAALGWTAMRPTALATSPLHPEVLACTHLVTIGCIATTCVGAWHAVLPIALRTRAPAGAVEWAMLAALQLVAIGVAAGMAFGTWHVVAWAGAALLALLPLQAWRWLPSWRAADGPRALRAGALIAFANLALAAMLGGLLAASRTSHPLLAVHPGTMWAHAHLALGGFAGTLVAAVGLRLLPMFLPAAPVAGPRPWLAVLGLGIGGSTCGIGALLTGAAGMTVMTAGELTIAAGAVAWLLCVVSMLRTRKPMPREVAAASPSRALIGAAVLSFATALAAGLALLAGAVTGPGWHGAYGALLIAGGFGSLILGIGQRLVPLAERLHSGRGPAHTLPSAELAHVTSLSWCAGLATLVAGVAAASPDLVRIGAGAMAAAVLADLVNVRRRGR